MNIEDKELLTRDICSRLPYDVKLGFANSNYILRPKLYNIFTKRLDTEQVSPEHEGNISFEYSIYNYLPYLRPLSTMTSEEFNELLGVICGAPYDYSEHHMVVQARIADIRTKWFDKKMFDHRELIPKGLALEAPEGMYET